MFLREISATVIRDNQKLLKLAPNTIKGEHTSCNTSQYLCCQSIHIILFRSIQTNVSFDIYFKVFCKKNYFIYLLECFLCKIQNFRKSYTWFHLILNDHRKYLNDHSAIEAYKYLNRVWISDYYFMIYSQIWSFSSEIFLIKSKFSTSLY